jgi:hypothetical protein
MKEFAFEDAVWIEAVEGLSNARERMQAIAGATPGRYFVFSSRDRSIPASTETFKMPEVSKAQGA